MRIFKFGGASVKDASGVRNLVKVLAFEGVKDTFMVVSAMGKMTNAFENIVKSYLYEKEKVPTALHVVATFHKEIIKDLFESEHVIFDEVNGLLEGLHAFLMHNKSTEYNYVYDQVVPYGELIATKIISAFLEKEQIANQWLDVRTLIKTDSNYRNATVDWKETEVQVAALASNTLYITQGFISSDEEGNTTTLGREGSDYTAGIIAYCMDATSVTIWKDVDGVLNADPRVFDATVLLEKISYQEAIEMAFYGASVIHPKTIKPLENKRIPLYVRSFIHLENAGTMVSKGVGIHPKTDCFIVKKNQILVSIAANDFSFILEENISDIFKLLHAYKLKVNLIQNSAISFSVCLEDGYQNFSKFYEKLKPTFNVKYNTGITLFTVRHFDADSIKNIHKKGEVLLQQTSRDTVQLAIAEKINYAN